MLRHGIYRAKYLLHMFQQNGYKFNEFSSWLLQHWNTILLPVPHLAMILVAMIGLAYLENRLTDTALTIIMVIFALFWFGNVSLYDPQRVKKPLVFTARMKRLTAVYTLLAVWIPLLGTSLAFYQGLLYPDIYILVFSWVVGDILLTLFLLVAASMIYPLEQWFQYRFKKKARRKIESMTQLTVIAITGSYGKTSTKFILDSVLKERYRVCTTPGSYNTPMGICKVINQDLKSSDQILILEMGARYVGNIDELCRIASPDVAIITNVGIAHLESFGSREAIARTKGALVRHLKPGGAAVLNGDDPEVRKMAGRGDVTTIFAGLCDQNNHLYARGIGYDEQGCSFQMHLADSFPETLRNISTDESSGYGAKDAFGQGESGVTSKEKMIEVRMSLLGEHSVQNALLASGVGMLMKLRLPTIKVALRKVSPIEHRLELKKRNGILIIDDAFNSNPTGAKNAISVLSAFETGRRFVITPGMIELGSKQEEENREFGCWMARHALDHIYLVGPEQTRPVYEGLMECGFEKSNVTVVDSLFEANDQLGRDLKAGDVVLYENDLPDSYSA